LVLFVGYYKRSPIPRRPRLAAEAPVFTVNGRDPAIVIVEAHVDKAVADTAPIRPICSARPRIAKARWPRKVVVVAIGDEWWAFLATPSHFLNLGSTPASCDARKAQQERE
jgi:hypothetical protein